MQKSFLEVCLATDCRWHIFNNILTRKPILTYDREKLDSAFPVLSFTFPIFLSSLLSIPALSLSLSLCPSHSTKRVSNDSMPWSHKCESTLLQALKVVLLEGLPLKWPWTVHREKNFEWGQSAACNKKSQ